MPSAADRTYPDTALITVGAVNEVTATPFVVTPANGSMRLGILTAGGDALRFVIKIPETDWKDEGNQLTWHKLLAWSDSVIDLAVTTNYLRVFGSGIDQTPTVDVHVTPAKLTEPVHSFALLVGRTYTYELSAPTVDSIVLKSWDDSDGALMGTTTLTATGIASTPIPMCVGWPSGSHIDNGLNITGAATINELVPYMLTYTSISEVTPS